MNLRNKHLLAATALALTAAISTVSTLADHHNRISHDALTQFVQENALGTPLGLVNLNSSGTRTVDGTGLRSVSNPGTETVDGTGLRSASSASTDTVDGTGLLRSVAPIGTETVDGTGRLRSIPMSNIADSVQPENIDRGE